MPKPPKQPEVNQANSSSADDGSGTIEQGSQQTRGGKSQPVGGTQRRRGEYDPLIVDSIFPDPAAVFTAPPVSLSSVKDSACVIPDTNALLLPYKLEKASLIEIERTYARLITDKRLFVPAQVAREFARNRAIKIGELYQSLTGRRERFQPKQVRPEPKPYPLLESFTEYQRILDIEQKLGKIDTEVKALADEYREKLTEALDRVRKWEWNDPISQIYGRLFTKELIIAPTRAPEQIRVDHIHRYDHDIPPGYADRHDKTDGGIGDLLIWYTILDIGKNNAKSVIFVSGEKKPDWWHQSGGEPLYPRYELFDEFRRYTGKSFHIIHLSELLKQFGAENNIVEEVRSKESRKIPSLNIGNHWTSAVESSVFKWLSKRYPLVERSSGFDNSAFTTLDDDGVTGFIIKIMITMGELKHHIEHFFNSMTMYLQSPMSALSDTQRYTLVLVLESENRARHAIGRLSLRPLRRRDRNDDL